MFDLKKVLILFALCLFLPALATAKCDGDSIATSDGYLVRSVRVNALFGKAPKRFNDVLSRHKGETLFITDHDFALFNGSPFEGTSRNFYMNEVRELLKEQDKDKSAISYSVNQQKSLQFRARVFDDCVTIVSPQICEKDLSALAGRPISKCVDIKIRIRALPINTGDLASNVLELPRTNQIPFYQDLPRPLLAFNPKFWVEQDKAFGTTAVAIFSTDLLNLKPTLEGTPKPVQDTKLTLTVDARRSLNKSFYVADSKLEISRSRPHRFLKEYAVSIGFSPEKQPVGDGTMIKNTFSIGANTTIKPKSRYLSQAGVRLHYRRTSNNLSKPSGVSERTIENGFGANAIFDGNIALGFYRGGVWFDFAKPNNNYESYSRLATLIGYSKNFVLKGSKCRVRGTGPNATCVFPTKNPPVFGVEILFGAGMSWGTVPQYARFYGGNSMGSFLYDSYDKLNLTKFPSEVLIRSMGRNSGGIVTSLNNTTSGGTAFQNLSLTLSLPIQRWSHPLIPNENVIQIPSLTAPLECENCTSLKDIIKIQVTKGKFIYIDAIAYQRLTEQQRKDLALDRDEGLTTEEEARLSKAEIAFEKAKDDFTPEADAEWNKLTPIVNYIADNANLYSVKPLILFDVARLDSTDTPHSRTRYALGGGLQFNVVVTKFDVGYMRAVRPQPGDSRGNFFVRMGFEKIF